MPTYPVIHKETGETKELSMTMTEYSKWREENPEWDKDWQAGCAAAQEVGEWKHKMSKTHPGWNDIMTRASKVRGSTIEW
ncbi:hypothetical protein S250808_235 [Synechococcus phage S-CAM3]|uniref:Uncharacterized protein n=1 Tax=Synechococcus phage S-CAM3 TaxID=1883366 RepID=A0A1D8KJB6_9CAUD|nr:hypothetical protein S250808_235 [Synechococcus phage S-CAM3]